MRTHASLMRYEKHLRSLIARKDLAYPMMSGSGRTITFMETGRLISQRSIRRSPM